jgi:hypothetical protein
LGYEGNALFQGVTFEGATPATVQNDRPDNAVEITGYVNNGSGNPATPVHRAEHRHRRVR